MWNSEKTKCNQVFQAIQRSIHTIMKLIIMTLLLRHKMELWSTKLPDQYKYKRISVVDTCNIETRGNNFRLHHSTVHQKHKWQKFCTFAALTKSLRCRFPTEISARLFCRICKLQRPTESQSGICWHLLNMPVFKWLPYFVHIYSFLVIKS